MPTATAEPPLRFSHFELHPAERMLRVRGETVALGSRAFDVLLALAQRHERLVTKQELLDLVWPGLVVEEHNVATQISTLRKLLGASAITTLPGYGYRLTAMRDALPASPAASPARSSAEPARHNLPQSRTRFIGREAALADIARLLPTTRLLTLTGIGGCGKTRLALQLAQEQLTAYADGVWFVDLAPLKDAQRERHRRGGAGHPRRGRQAAGGAAARHLGPRRVLLVLDNCEHVIDGVVAVGRGSARRQCRRATILATSREGLGVAGEQVYPVRSLSLPASADDLPARAGRRVGARLRRSRAAGACRTSRSMPTMLRRWPRSAGGWTASRWPSNWRPRA